MNIYLNKEATKVFPVKYAAFLWSYFHFNVESVTPAITVLYEELHCLLLPNKE